MLCKMMQFRLIRLVMSRAHGSGISTACYPPPASVHRSRSGDKERLTGTLSTGPDTCARPGATSRNRSGYPGGSRRTLPDLVVGVSPLHNPAARSVLETAPCRWRSSPTPIPQVRGIGSRVTSQPLHCLGHNALFCCRIPTQGSILLSCLTLMATRLVGTPWQHLVI